MGRNRWLEFLDNYDVNLSTVSEGNMNQLSRKFQK